MAILTTALISALAPAAIDAAKSLFGGIGRKIGGLSVDDEIKLASADVERIKALAALDAPFGTPSQWVVDLRLSFRYIAAGLFVVGGIGIMVASLWLPVAAILMPMGAELASAASGFIFGERALLSLKSKATV